MAAAVGLSNNHVPSQTDSREVLPPPRSLWELRVGRGGVVGPRPGRRRFLMVFLSVCPQISLVFGLPP